MNEIIKNGTLKQLEFLRAALLRETLDEYQGYSMFRFNKTIPNEDRKPLYINGFPVFQFVYKGSLPLFDKFDKKYLRSVQDYYFEATANLYNFKENKVRFDKATLIIQHYQREHIISDLDNRCRKFIIDAIRYTGVIKDDNWQTLSLYEEGKKTEGDPFINVFLVDERNTLEFLHYKDQYSEEEIIAAASKISYSLILKKHKEDLKKQKESNQKLEDFFD